MEEQKEINGMLNLIVRPAFCAKDGKILQVNPAAKGLFLSPGMELSPLLLTGKEEYAAFSGGCLYLSLSVSGQRLGASVVRTEDSDVFLLEQDSDQAELRSLALAARELREPLSSIIISAERLFPEAEASEQAARLNRGLYQMLRIIGNMSDAGRSPDASRQETQNLSALLSEIFEKAQALVSYTGVSLTYEGLEEPIYGLADQDQLERAVLNLVSNAVKFTPKGGAVQARLAHVGRMLRLSIQDTGSGIADEILGTVFTRYLRQPAIEDSRFGLGLGTVLVRTAAASHGGTVLIDQPDGQGTRVTLTLAIRQNEGRALRSPIFRVDYTGERDHALVELAQYLPPELYRID